MAITIMTHNGQKVIYFDYTNSRGEALADVIKECTDKGIKETGPEGGYYLVDVTGSVGDKFVIAALKDSAKAFKPFSKKMAILGVEGVKKTLAGFISMASDLKFKLFDDKESAIDWLAKKGS
jgi:hypothetical protein